MKSKEVFTKMREEEISRDETLTNLFRSFGAIYMKGSNRNNKKLNETRYF